MTPKERDFPDSINMQRKKKNCTWKWKWDKWSQ
jgi:hypothetical protein